MEKSTSMRKSTSVSSTRNERETQQIASDRLLQKIMSDIEVMKEKLNDKNSELGILHAKLENAEEEIDRLHRRIKCLEDHVKHQEDPQNNIDDHRTATRNQAKKKLLLGDSTLREIRPSDLGSDTIIRTIPEANLDLLASWVKDKLVYPVSDCIIYGGLLDMFNDD